MAMTANGLAKLSEEIGELQIELGALQQVVAKKLAYMDTDEHPDGAGPLSKRLEAEMGDVLGAIEFVSEKIGLDKGAIGARSLMKFNRFRAWDAD